MQAGRIVDLLSEQLVLVGGGKAQAVSPPEVLQKVALMKLVLPSRIHELRAIIDRLSRKRGVTLIPEIELDSLEAPPGATQPRGDAPARTSVFTFSGKRARAGDAERVALRPRLAPPARAALLRHEASRR